MESFHPSTRGQVWKRLRGDQHLLPCRYGCCVWNMALLLCIGEGKGGLKVFDSDRFWQCSASFASFCQGDCNHHRFHFVAITWQFSVGWFWLFRVWIKPFKLLTKCYCLFTWLVNANRGYDCFSLSWGCRGKEGRAWKCRANPHCVYYLLSCAAELQRKKSTAITFRLFFLFSNFVLYLQWLEFAVQMQALYFVSCIEWVCFF